MSERNEYPPGVPCWVDTLQPDPGAATRCYAQIFGWDFVGAGAMPGAPPGEYYVAQLRGRDVAGVGSLPQGAPPNAAWNTYISAASVDDAARRVEREGGAVVVAPFDVPPTGRIAVLRDPAGAIFCAWKPDGRQGAQIINEPSAWAMSALLTNDPDRACAFYGAVFGWQTDTFDAGGQKVTLFRLPGFVGGEPQQPVPRDVVAILMGMDRVPPHWNVDFWVSDTDAVVTQLKALGGTVIVPPHDAPAFRSANVVDPYGAAFSVSQLLARG